MAVFRVERTRDYTVMSNYHLRDENLTLKSKGLLSMMLSLPDDWNYTTRGLAKICKEGVDAIGSALKELESTGYIIRHQLRDNRGRISDTEYVIYEKPQKPKKQADSPAPDMAEPGTLSPDTENPDMVKPDTDSPDTKKPAELNKEKSRKEKINTDGLSTDSIPFFSRSAAAEPPEPKRREAALTQEYEDYRELILENIEYDILCRQHPYEVDTLDEIVELMLEVVCVRRQFTRVAGSDFPHEVVKSRLLKLNGEHIQFVLGCMKENTTKVRNIKQYLLTVLFNAPTTISNYYSALVNHDMAEGRI